ncbi:MAG: hypothetical protein OEV65_10915 [Aquincola sp.]|nr:hypothetical protein [Aquincola sp.]
MAARRKGMKRSRPSSLAAAAARLRAVAHRFDPAALEAKREALARAARATLRDARVLPRYHELLLFLLAHPADAAQRTVVEAEMRRLAAFLRTRRGRHGAWLDGEGLPWVETAARFSHDCVRWLMGHPHARVTLDGFGEGARADLNAVLRLTLPSVERSETTAELDNLALLDTLRVPRSRRLAFVIDELARLDSQPFVKDHLFDSLELFVTMRPTDRRLSRAYSRLPVPAVFFQRDLLRAFDARALMDSPLPALRPLDRAARDDVVRVVKTAFVLTSRETDPGTYLDERALAVVDLERGLTVAVYGMVPERQLPLESYAGFTLFKNGLAAAYGGAWLLGRRAGFGMNIFEPYRGGESGYMMCQVLRTYRQLFGVSFFEVDAHQFGLDNPDGIATGAFWFYYRYGFRPLDAALARLAEHERATMRRRPGHRSNEKTLLRFTGSNVALNFGGPVPPHLFDLTTLVTRMVQRRYRSDRQAAERDCLRRLASLTGPLDGLDAAQRAVAVEVALVARAMDLDDTRRLGLLRRMIQVKPVNLFAYQHLWLEFFDGHEHVDGDKHQV